MTSARETVDDAALALLKPLLPTVFVVVTAFAVFNYVAAPDRLVIPLANAAVVIASAVAWNLSRQNRIPRAWAHGVSASFGLALAGPTLLRFHLGGERICAVLLILEILSFGIISLSRKWFFPSVGSIVIGWFLVSLPWMTGRTYFEHALAVFAAAALANLAFEVRRRSVLGNAKLLQRAKEARRELEEALVTAHREIGDRVRAEAEREELRNQLLQSQKMEAIGRLAGGLAHDMNNVLASISGLADVLCEEFPHGSAQHEDIMAILQAAKRGADLTRNLLAFSRKGKYRQEPIFLDTVLRDVTELLERTLPKGTSIHTTTAHVGVSIEGDPGQFSHALVNVCINASDAMGEGGVIRLVTERVTVDQTIGAKLGVAPGPYVAIRAIDHGCGMDAETKKKVFEPFFTTKAVGEGTGLGLSMVYGTMQSHSGAVEIESDLGKGTTVSLYLPVRRQPKSSASFPPGVRTADPASRLGKGTILVVDDEPLVRAAATRVLGRLGYEVMLASDGQEAIDIFGRDHASIDLVLLDMGMPVMGGTECFGQLKEIDPRVRVVICSGFAPGQETESLLANGAAALVEKPYSLGGLNEVLETVLRERV